MKKSFEKNLFKHQLRRNHDKLTFDLILSQNRAVFETVFFAQLM